MISSKVLCRILLLPAALISGCSSYIRLHEGFRPEEMVSKAIVVLPPEIAFFIKHEHKEEPKPEYSLEAARNVQDAIANVLRREGMKVQSLREADRSRIRETNDLSTPDENMASSVARAQQSFQAFCEALGNAAKQPHAPSLEAGLNALARLPSDYVILVRGYAHHKPRTARNVIRRMNTIGVAYNQLSGLHLEVALVDVRTSQVLWYNRNHDIESDYDPLAIASVEVLCSKILRSLVDTRAL